MFIALHKRLAEREEGFTLIELLVVIIIIGILAAIAIPTFLNQREKGWESAAKSELRNAAIAQESYFTENAAYTANVADLQAEGFNPSADIVPALSVISIDNAGDPEYCMTAQHQSGGDVFYLGSESGEPTTTACT